MNKDTALKLGMMALLLIMIILLGYNMLHIRELSEHPCKVCMDKFSGVWCHPFFEGNVDWSTVPNWMQSPPLLEAEE